METTGPLELDKVREHPRPEDNPVVDKVALALLVPEVVQGQARVAVRHRGATVCPMT